MENSIENLYVEHYNKEYLLNFLKRCQGRLHIDSSAVPEGSLLKVKVFERGVTEYPTVAIIAVPEDMRPITAEKLKANKENLVIEKVGTRKAMEYCAIYQMKVGV